MAGYLFAVTDDNSLNDIIKKGCYGTQLLLCFLVEFLS